MKMAAKKTKTRRTKKDASRDFDSPWKEMLDRFFEPCIEFFFPAAHAAIDWSRGVEFLDKELQKIMADAAIGRRLADKLAKVYLLTGEELWVLAHLEVQGQPQKVFPQRMYVYSYRTFERYGRMVASFAILTDDDPKWRPCEFSYRLLGTELSLKFETVKLLDYASDWDRLANSDNPFAVVVMTHLKALETRKSPEQRYRWKMELVKGLYQRGYDAEDVRQLFRFIDWLLKLPEDLAATFSNELITYEEKRKMRYVTSVERIGMKKGLQKGRQEGLQEGQQKAAVALVLRQLRRKLEPLSVRAVHRIEQLPLEKIELLSEDLLDFTVPKDLSAWLKRHAGQRKTRQAATN